MKTREIPDTYLSGKIAGWQVDVCYCRKSSEMPCVPRAVTRPMSELIAPIAIPFESFEVKKINIRGAPMDIKKLCDQVRQTAYDSALSRMSKEVLTSKNAKRMATGTP